MSDEKKDTLNGLQDAQQPAAASMEPTLSAEKLDEIDEMDFLLEEIENKIAPLALA